MPGSHPPSAWAVIIIIINHYKHSRKKNQVHFSQEQMRIASNFHAYVLFQPEASNIYTYGLAPLFVGFAVTLPQKWE